MSASIRFLYLIEFLIGYSVPVIALVLGIIFSPVAIVGLFEGKPESILFLLLVISGSVGFWGAVSLITLTLHPHNSNTPPLRLKFYIAIGVVPISSIGILSGQENGFFTVVSLLTLLVTLHLTIKQRQYLLNEST